MFPETQNTLSLPTISVQTVDDTYRLLIKTVFTSYTKGKQIVFIKRVQHNDVYVAQLKEGKWEVALGVTTDYSRLFLYPYMPKEYSNIDHALAVGDLSIPILAVLSGTSIELPPQKHLFGEKTTQLFFHLQELMTLIEEKKKHIQDYFFKHRGYCFS